jgi:hypothetical protein
MPFINGVDFNDINAINGVSWNSVADISGVEVTHGATCTPTPFGYADGKRFPPSDACLRIPQNYDFDSVNQLLYISGGCGTTFAIAGYYSNGIEIFFWDGAGSWTNFGRCGR